VSSGAGRGGRGFGRGSLSGRLRDDHALTAAVAIGAAAGDDLATTAAAALDNLAAAIAAVASRLTGTALFSHFFAMATILATEEAVALLAAVAAMMTGKQTTVALPAMAAVTSDRTGITAHEGDGHECEEHRQRKTEKPLHQKPPTGGKPNAAAASAKPSRMEPRSGTATGPQQQMFHYPQPAHPSSACEDTQAGKNIPATENSP
jgi:hypothetical protein